MRSLFKKFFNSFQVFRKQSKKEVELTNRLEAIIHNAPVYLTIFDQNGVYTYADGKILRARGLKTGELVGQSIFERYKDYPEVLEKISSALKGTPVETELNIGEDWYHYSSRPVFDKEGKVISVMAIAFDISERRHAEIQTAETNRRLETVLNNAPLILWGTDVNGVVTFSEGKGLYAIGAKPGQLVGESVFEIYKYRPDSLDCLERALAGETVNRVVQNGETIFDTIYAPIRNAQGEVSGIVGLSVDITARKKVEAEKAEALLAEAAAKEASQIKSNFLATMSHEIRTPINGVIGMTTLLLETNLNEEQKKYAEAVRVSANSLLFLINDILDLSKAEAGKIDIESVSFDFNHLLNNVEKTMSFAIESKGLQFKKDFSKELPAFLRGDPNRLKQVLFNLINNAIKFTLHGEIKLSIAVENVEGEKISLKFAVTDTGIGIPAGAVNRLFQPFTQADSSTTRQFGGTGLGLSISKHLVELMGGTIGVSSEEGVGSTFWFILPFTPDVQGVVDIAPDATIMTAADHLKILIAEDNSVNQFIAIKFLEKMGHEVVTTFNGQETIEALKKDKFDLVFMDCQMPIMDGFQATKKIRMSNESFKTIPIVAMTANAMAGDREICLNAGMDDYITKPIKPKDLSDAIKRIFKEKN